MADGAALSAPGGWLERQTAAAPEALRTSQLDPGGLAAFARGLTEQPAR